MMCATSPFSGGAQVAQHTLRHHLAAPKGKEVAHWVRHFLFPRWRTAGALAHPRKDILRT